MSLDLFEKMFYKKNTEQMQKIARGYGIDVNPLTNKKILVEKIIAINPGKTDKEVLKQNKEYLLK